VETVRILIADYNEAFRENLAELLAANFAVRTCSNGTDAAVLLETFDPDILVLDIMLPNADVFALMETAISRSAEVYVFSSFLTVPVRERLLSAGVYGMMSKNSDIYHAEYNIRALARRTANARNRRENHALRALLQRLGFQTHRDGYNQLLMAIPMYQNDPRQPLGKVIYAAIAKEMGLNDAGSVERSIRDAILDYCDTGDTVLWSRLFPPDTRNKKGYPANKTFISRISEHLRIDQETK
jgi:CheY-like chemotaxis protein